MTTTTLNKRLDRLQAPSDGSHGIADRLNQARVAHRAKQEEYRRLGLTQEEIGAKEADERRDWLARVKPITPLGKRLYQAILRLAETDKRDRYGRELGKVLAGGMDGSCDGR